MNQLVSDGQVTEQARQWWCEKITCFFLAIIVLLSWNRHGWDGAGEGTMAKGAPHKGAQKEPKKKLGLKSWKFFCFKQREQEACSLHAQQKKLPRMQAKRFSQNERVVVV
jgi:hypothetical protein